MAFLRNALPDDLSGIQALLGGSRLPHQDIDAARIAHFLVAAGEQSLRGAVGIEVYGEDALLRSLVVNPDSRAAGLGSQLAEAMERQARLAGVSTVYLLTTTAEAFFARRGYETIARSEAPAALQATTEFSSLCPSQAICMRRRLG